MSNMDQPDLTKNDAQHGVTKIFGSKRQDNQDNLKRVVFGEQNKESAIPVVIKADITASTMTEGYIFSEAAPSYVELAPTQAIDLAVDLEDNTANEQALTEEDPEMQTLTEEMSEVSIIPVTLIQIEHPLAQKVRELEEFTKLFPTHSGVLEEEDTGFDLSVFTMDPDIDSLLVDKVKEFHFLGYERVTVDEIRNYIQQIRKRRPRNLHELVNTILVLQPQQVMNFDIQSAYRNSSQSLEDILSDLS